MVTIFRVTQNEDYAYLAPSPYVMEEFRRRMSDGIWFDQSARGIRLQSRWNADWEFVIDQERIDDHPLGLGDFADMNKLIAANEAGYRVLKPLVGTAAEILTGRCNGRTIWFFNIIRHVHPARIPSLDDGDIFRVKPTGLDILCGPKFKEEAEASGLKGLWFRQVDPDDTVPMI